jgi:hypothetical protein
VALVVGVLLHLAVGYLVLVGGLVMPAGAVVGLAVVWAVALFLAFRMRRQPVAVILIPLVTLGIWFLTAWVGDTFFGWTA